LDHEGSDASADSAGGDRKNHRADRAEEQVRVPGRAAIERFFGVKVLDVRTAHIYGKPKRMGRFTGRRPDWKKAIVTLAPDNKIDMFDVV
jgi:large subunit ribosomal protein L23